MGRPRVIEEARQSVTVYTDEARDFTLRRALGEVLRQTVERQCNNSRSAQQTSQPAAINGVCNDSPATKRLRGNPSESFVRS